MIVAWPCQYTGIFGFRKQKANPSCLLLNSDCFVCTLQKKFQCEDQGDHHSPTILEHSIYLEDEEELKKDEKIEEK